MIIFADASFLYNNYYQAQAHAETARRFWRRDISVVSSAAAILEFRLGSIYESGNADGWERFKEDSDAGKFQEVPVEWEKLLTQFAPLASQHRANRVGLADGLHVLAALQCGATHFLSFDFRSGQRAFARAVGLTVLPEKMKGEF